MPTLRLCSALPLVTALFLAGALPDAAATPSPSPDGQQVIDPATRLAWARCLVGQRWDGKQCAGPPTLLRQAEALSQARALSRQTGQSWRVPRVAELQRLVRKGGEGLDQRLFPGAPADWHWSSTPSLSHGQVNPYNYGSVMRGQTSAETADSSFVNGSAVHLGDGQARDDVPKGSKLAVRLVRDVR